MGRSTSVIWNPHTQGDLTLPLEDANKRFLYHQINISIYKDEGGGPELEDPDNVTVGTLTASRH